MAGSLHDLASLGLTLPSPIVLDTSVVINWMTAVGWSTASTPASPAQIGAAQLVAQMVGAQKTAVITPTALNEVFHYVLKSGFRAAVPNYQSDLVARFPRVRRYEWHHLFKARSDLIAPIVADLDRIRHLMHGNRMLVLQPDDLGPVPSGRTLDDELVRTMARYQLDSNDAAILIDARRAGITAVASSDADFHRAQLDFDVYTWL